MTEATNGKNGRGRPMSFDREQALCVALELFWKKGYEPTSVSELCDKMGIKPPSLYCSFGNKAALFLESVEYYENKYWRQPAEHFLDEPDLYKGVEKFFEEAARLLLSPHAPCGCMVVLATVNISPDEKEIIEAIQQLRLQTLDMFAFRLKQAISDGQIPPDTDVPALAGALNCFLEGMSLQTRNGIYLSQLLAIARNASRLLPEKPAD